MRKMQSSASRPWQLHIKPVIDEWQLTDFSTKIQQSFQSKVALEFTLFGGLENYTIYGIVDRLDKTLNSIRIAVNGEFEWISLSEIVSIEAS